jgi:hypothetical protein
MYSHFASNNLPLRLPLLLCTVCASSGVLPSLSRSKLAALLLLLLLLVLYVLVVLGGVSVRGFAPGFASKLL